VSIIINAHAVRLIFAGIQEGSMASSQYVTVVLWHFDTAAFDCHTIQYKSQFVTRHTSQGESEARG